MAAAVMETEPLGNYAPPGDSSVDGFPGQAAGTGQYAAADVLDSVPDAPYTGATVASADTMDTAPNPRDQPWPGEDPTAYSQRTGRSPVWAAAANARSGRSAERAHAPPSRRTIQALFTIGTR